MGRTWAKFLEVEPGLDIPQPDPFMKIPIQKHYTQPTIALPTKIPFPKESLARSQKFHMTLVGHLEASGSLSSSLHLSFIFPLYVVPCNPVHACVKWCPAPKLSIQNQVSCQSPLAQSLVPSLYIEFFNHEWR